MILQCCFDGIKHYDFHEFFHAIKEVVIGCHDICAVLPATLQLLPKIKKVDRHAA